MTDKLKELLSYIHDKLTQREMPSEQALAEMADRIESALEQPDVEAAEIEVPYIVAHLMRSDRYETYVNLNRDNSADVVEPLMTVAQHRRILAGVNQKAGSGVPDIAPGVNRCVAYLENRASEYVNDHGSYDDDTGSTEFRNPHQEDYYNELHELADSFRAMLKAAPLPPSPAAKAGEA